MRPYGAIRPSTGADVRRIRVQAACCPLAACRTQRGDTVVAAIDRIDQALPVLGEFLKCVCGVRIAARGKASKLIQVLPLDRQLDEQVRGIGTALCREAPKFVQIIPLASELNQLRNSVAISGCGLGAQLDQVPVSHWLIPGRP